MIDTAKPCLTDNILNDKTKFKLLDNDPTLLREGRLKRFITQLKKKRSIDDDTYCNIFPKGSQPAKFYGLPKLHKKRDNHRQPPLRPIDYHVSYVISEGHRILLVVNP